MKPSVFLISSFLMSVVYVVTSNVVLNWRRLQYVQTRLAGRGVMFSTCPVRSYYVTELVNAIYFENKTNRF